MIIPLARNLTGSSGILTWIYPRRGGGEGGAGGGKGSSSGESSSSGSSSSDGGSKGGSFGVGTDSASSSSRGGGTPTPIGNGSQFAGRLSGGGSRDQIYGNCRIGSGYPYGGYGTFYGGRPFPYVFYPIYISPGYYGGDEYGPTQNDTRPGGPLSTAVVFPNNNTSQNSYYLVGDQSSVATILKAVVSQCGVVNSTVTNTYINGTTTLNDTALVPRPEQVVQYYRASSFALALLSYNNSGTLPSRAPASNDSAPPPLSDDTPLPSGINMTFLTCLNTTIASTVPLLDTGSGEHRLTVDDILDISIVCFPIFLILLLSFLRYCAAQCPPIPKQEVIMIGRPSHRRVMINGRPPQRRTR